MLSHGFSCKLSFVAVIIARLTTIRHCVRPSTVYWLITYNCHFTAWNIVRMHYVINFSEISIFSCTSHSYRHVSEVVKHLIFWSGIVWYDTRTNLWKHIHTNDNILLKNKFLSNAHPHVITYTPWTIYKLYSKTNSVMMFNMRKSPINAISRHCLLLAMK